MMDTEELFQKFLQQKCSKEEAEMLLELFRQEENSKEIVDLINQKLQEEAIGGISDEDKTFIARQKIMLREAMAPKRSWFKDRRKALMLSVGVTLLFCLAGLSIYYNSMQSNSSQDTLVAVQDVVPGGNKATITLSTGERIELDSLESVLAIRNGQFYYEGGKTIVDASASQFVTLTTPVGGEYQLVLSDGTKVWLNAASSIKYPVVFEGDRRRVEVNGEAYFEVVPIKNRPFIVSNSQQEIEVLGTAFNVRNYAEASITTLVHGSIALQNKKSDERILLAPNEQAQLIANKLKVKTVDAADYVSWISGLILHKDARLRDICQELERWYGVHFVFSDKVNSTATAIISINRKELLSEVLLALEDTYLVKFEIQGKEVIVR